MKAIMQDDRLIRYRCNICGTHNGRPRSELGRESDSCTKCHSTVRMRAMVHLVTRHLHGQGVVACEMPASRHTGLGLSDWVGYASVLQSKTGYTNTFYTRAPQLDITRPPAQRRESVDFIIASDVFEHVAPPVSAAFEGAAFLLRLGGLLAFSVPYLLEGPTREHFPELHDFRVEGKGDERRLLNRTQDGRLQTFTDLCFHGGEGATLEMRLFSLQGLRAMCRESGLGDPLVMEDVEEFGIVWLQPWSRAMFIRKPG